VHAWLSQSLGSPWLNEIRPANFGQVATWIKHFENRSVADGAHSGPRHNCDTSRYRRSTTGPAGGLLQYQIGTNGGFVDIADLSYSSSSSSGASLGPIDLSGVGPLQKIAPDTSVFFRIVNYGSGPLGTWYIFDRGNSSAPDLVLQGTLEPAAPLPSVPCVS